jgi:hypothetical protein
MLSPAPPLPAAVAGGAAPETRGDESVEPHPIRVRREKDPASGQEVVIIEVGRERVELSSTQAKDLGKQIRDEGLWIERQASEGKREAGRAAAWEGTPFAVLGLCWPCTEEEVRAAYKRLTKTAHPDRGGSPEEFRRIREAYERALGFLSNPFARFLV